MMSPRMKMNGFREMAVSELDCFRLNGARGMNGLSALA